MLLALAVESVTRGVCLLIYHRCLGFEITPEEIKTIKTRVWQSSGSAKGADGKGPKASSKGGADLFALPLSVADKRRLAQAQQQPRKSVPSATSAPTRSASAKKPTREGDVEEWESSGEEEGDGSSSSSSSNGDRGWFTFRGFLAMFDMLFQKKSVNRMLWTVLRYHGYQPEHMECPVYEESDSDEEDGQVREGRREGRGCLLSCGTKETLLHRNG